MPRSCKRPGGLRSVACLLVGVAGAQAASSAAIVPLLNDTGMPLANWSAAAINTTGGFGFSVSNPAGGGNGGAYRGITHSSTAGFAQGTVIHTHALGWNPSTQGAITTLDMRVDVNCFNGGTSAAVGFGLVVVQGGSVFFGPTFTALSFSGWRTDLQATGLTAASFNSAIATNPDFTAGGSAIAFGFFSSNGTASGVPIASTSGADNFAVVLDVVPAPGAAALLAAAGMVSVRRRR
ncbi:MAG: hypothetical protein ACKVS8_13730 [Phycisphaerales bacterium]